MPSLTMTAALALADLASFSTESKNQQQSIIASHREEEEDKLLWSAASTQTEGQQQQPGPRGETPPMAVPEITEESILKAAAAIPKLGEIAAQFSTDSVSLATQTDDLEMLLKPSTTTLELGLTLLVHSPLRQSALSSFCLKFLKYFYCWVIIALRLGACVIAAKHGKI